MPYRNGDITFYVCRDAKNSRLEIDVLFNVHRHTRKKTIRVLLLGVEPKTFRLVARMLNH